MKIFQFTLCFFLMTSTIHGIIVYENSNVTKRSPSPYHSYIEFKDKREGGGYGYKFQIEGDHTEQQTHWPQPKFQETNIEENNSYLPENYEQVPSYTHQVPIPKVKQRNVHIKQEQPVENEPQPQITFESNKEAIQHEKENEAIFNNYPHGSEANLQSFPNLFFPNHERGNPTANSAPIKLSQIPIITKYVPVPVKYIPMPVKEPVVPSRGHIKFTSGPLNALPTNTEPIIFMKPNIVLSSEASNAPVKYIMIPVQPSLDTKIKNMFNKQIHYQPNPEHQHQEHLLNHQEQHMPIHIQHQPNYEEEMAKKQHYQQIKNNIPVKYMDYSNKHLYKEKEETKYIPQNQFVKPVESNNQFFFKYNQEASNEDIQKMNEENYREYLPNRLAQPFVDKQVVQYHIKTNIPEKNIPPMEGQPMYEYKTIQEEDYKNLQPSVDYEMFNMPELINKLPVNTIDLQQKFVPQNFEMHPQQNFMFPNNIG